MKIKNYFNLTCLLFISIINNNCDKKENNSLKLVPKELVSFFPGDTSIELSLDPKYWRYKECEYIPTANHDFGESINCICRDPKGLLIKNRIIKGQKNNIRYIYEYYGEINLAKHFPKKYQSVGLHIGLNADLKENTNGFISIMSLEKIEPYQKNGYVDEMNKWYDYQIQDDGSICKPPFQCRGGDFPNNIDRIRKKYPVSIGAINDMEVFKGHKIKLQIVLEANSKASNVSVIKVDSIEFHYYTKNVAALRKMYSDTLLIPLMEVVDDGQSGPRRPPRNQ